MKGPMVGDLINRFGGKAVHIAHFYHDDNCPKIANPPTECACKPDIKIHEVGVDCETCQKELGIGKA